MNETPTPSDPVDPSPSSPDGDDPAAAAAATPASPQAAPDRALPSPARRRRGRGVALLALAFALGLGAVAGAAGAGLAAWDAGYQGRILPGVHVGAVDLSGLDRASAAAALRAALPYGQGALVLHTSSGDITIPYSAFGRRANVDALVDAALQAGRNGDLATRAASELGQALHGVSLAPSVELDRAALAAAVTGALTPLATRPVDATVAVGSKGFVTTPAHDGSTIDAAPVIAAALARVEAADAPEQVVVAAPASAVPPVVSDDAVVSAASRAGLAVSDLTVAYGKRTWTIKAATVRSWIVFTTAADGTVQPGVDVAKIPASLKSIAKQVLKPATSAIFLRAKSGRVVGVAPSADGRKLDVAATSQRIADEVMARLPAGVRTPVKVALAPVPPKLTTEQAKLKAPVLTLLGTWTTWFPISDHNYYGANIWIPAQIINGTLLAPGQTFDWWSAVGDVTPARGFGPGGVIKGDHTDPTGALGGGMCSSSTTLFNAALRAGLQMGARGNHRYYINRYPLGLDATVWKIGSAVQDMTFTNDTSHPILIRGLKSVGGGGRGYVTYQLWGIPDGRTVSLSAPAVSNVVRAVTKTAYVSTLPHGVRDQVEYPSNQMDVAVTRVVRDRAGRMIHTEVWRSHYVLWNGLIEIGL